MKTDPPVTYRGAAQVIGRYDYDWLSSLDQCLKGYILESPDNPTPAVIWPWIDSESDLALMIRRGLEIAARHLAGAAGHERHELVAAAHTTIVIASFIEAFKGEIAGGRYEPVRDKRTINLHADVTKTAATTLFRTAVSSPSAVVDFENNIDAIDLYLRQVGGSLVKFMRNLTTSGRRVPRDNDAAVTNSANGAIGSYRLAYNSLAIQAPELLLYILVGQHSLTWTEIDQVSPVAARILDRQAQALSMLERLLLLAAPMKVQPDSRHIDVLTRANQCALSEPVVPIDSLRYFVGVQFPKVEEIYVTPKFRVATYTDHDSPSQDEWWEEHPARDDLDVFLAAHFASVDSTRKPTLLLGHPGAGKSMFTRLIAARLPADSYIAVRVPLRRVDADAKIYEQIQESFDYATHGRLQWVDVVEASRDRIRVVLLDGFDELLVHAEQSGNETSNLVLPLGYQFVDNDLFIVMALAEESLKSALRPGPFALPVGVDVVRQIARGLEQLTAVTIVHRDLKPDNVLRYGTTWKITDFGLSKSLSEGSVTVSLAGWGTDPYTAPELWNNQPATPRSDLYALGVLAFELFTGAPPFPGPRGEYRRQHLQDAPPDLPALPSRLARLILRLLAKNPAERPQDARAVVEAIDAYTLRLRPDQEALVDAALQLERARASGHAADAVAVARSEQLKALRLLAATDLGEVLANAHDDVHEALPDARIDRDALEIVVGGLRIAFETSEPLHLSAFAQPGRALLTGVIRLMPPDLARPLGEVFAHLTYSADPEGRYAWYYTGPDPTDRDRRLLNDESVLMIVRTVLTAVARRGITGPA